MAYFPMFVDMSTLKVLVVGGGSIAMDKIEKLLDFTKEITVIAIEVDDDTQRLIERYALTLHTRAYSMGDIQGFDVVIAATDIEALHRSIYEESRGSRILLNSVDDTEYCDFIFPSYIKKDDLTIAFSTGGASPAFAKQLRQYFEEVVPHSVGKFLQKMKNLRTSIPKSQERMRYFDGLVKDYFKKYFTT